MVYHTHVIKIITNTDIKFSTIRASLPATLLVEEEMANATNYILALYEYVSIYIQIQTAM